MLIDASILLSLLMSHLFQGVYIFRVNKEGFKKKREVASRDPQDMVFAVNFL
jgi:hypothetical protein